MSVPAQPPTASASTFLSAFIPVFLVAVIGTTAFLVLRPKFKRIYQPRTFLSSLRPQERTPDTSGGGMFGWISQFLKIPDTYVLTHHSMDAYFLLRFFRVGCVILLVGCCLTFPILWPVYGTAGGTQIQFGVISLANVPGSNNPRLYALTFVAWAYFGFVWYMIAREMIYYVNLRQAYLLSPLYANRISSKTVLYASVPKNYCSEQTVRQLFKATPPKNVWVSTDCKELTDLVEQRTSAALKLEGAETKLIKTANKNRLKALKKDPSLATEGRNGATADMDGESGSIAGRWVQPKDRPTHRLKFLIGKKVDTINWCREEIARLTPQIEKLQNQHRATEAEPVGSIFVEFTSQAEAQAAYQSTTHHQALHMTPRFIGVNPNEVVWSNLGLSWWQRLLRKTSTTTFLVLLLVFWAIPVAFVGILSNISKVLPATCHGPSASSSFNGPSWMQWLCFITYLPSALFGLIQGLLPSVLLAVLMALVPIIIRLMVRIGGAPTTAAIELSTQDWFYAFQVIEVFLATTLGSTASSVATTIGQDPSSAPTLLATNIPNAAYFYMAYIMTQGLSIFWGSLLQIVGLVLFKLLGKILDSTPRKMYKRWMSLSNVTWGTVFPMYEFYVMICLIYSCLTPLLLGFALIALYLMYQAFRYNLIFTTNATIDTKGLVYPKALNHMTVGLYVAEITYIGILAVDEAPGPAILMAVFTVFSILFHMSLSKAIGPLLYTLPTSLAVEEERMQALENGQGSIVSGSIDSSNFNKAGKMDAQNGTHELTHSTTLPAPHAKPNLFTKWLRPDKFADFETMRRLVPQDFATINYPRQVETDAFFDPSIKDEAPILWIPRDNMGISRQEVAHTSKVIEITDQEARFTDEGKIEWDNEKLPPVHQEKIYY